MDVSGEGICQKAHTKRPRRRGIRQSDCIKPTPAIWRTTSSLCGLAADCRCDERRNKSGLNKVPFRVLTGRPAALRLADVLWSAHILFKGAIHKKALKNNPEVSWRPYQWDMQGDYDSDCSPEVNAQRLLDVGSFVGQRRCCWTGIGITFSVFFIWSV